MEARGGVDEGAGGEVIGTVMFSVLVVNVAVVPSEESVLPDE